MQFDNNMRGVLFKNDEKRPDKKDPDYQGQAEIEGVEYWLSAWIQESKKGNKFMSLRFNPKEERVQRKELEKLPSSTPTPAFNDDIPF